MREIASEQRVAELIDELSASLARRIADRPESAWAMVGVKRRGDVLAKRLADRLAARLPRDPFAGRVGSLDITLYRDDLTEIGPQPIVRTSDVPFALDGLHLVLVDDVLMSGRSVRAALQSLMDFGRPSRVWLAVLVDRGGRELPIHPDDAALKLDPADHDGRDRVLVHLTPIEKADRITIEPAVNEVRG